MYKKFIAVSILSLLSQGASAGLFDSNDFKCGREDANNAILKYIKDEASGVLQSKYLAAGKSGFSRSLNDYQGELDAINISASNISTMRTKDDELSCSASISFKVSPATLTVIGDDPTRLYRITQGSGKFNNGNVVWKNVTYQLKLADNGKDIQLDNLSNYNEITLSLYQSSLMGVDKETIIQGNGQSRVVIAKHKYDESDIYLNQVWKGLPESARNSMRREQGVWVNQKAAKCGKLSDAELSTTPAEQRVKIYQCQEKLTQERIVFLGGEEE
ncbi:lysozyme inhibitor LprI family protein [Dryocola sp. BD626]|uniref:lysozyme inhibitor LprI family protein n=1 Tax=Dryocola sp. BD626 TaxID=3133273 RepID=UPI003F509D8A